MISYTLTGWFIAIIAIIITYYKWSFTYWSKRGVKTPKPSIPFGNSYELFTRKITLSLLCKRIYHELRSKNQTQGGIYIFTRPSYLAIDTEIIKHILLKDFDHFVNRGVYFNEKDDPLSVHLFNIEDAKWRNLRAKLTPTFTSGKMKMMFQTLVDCSENLISAIDANKNKPIDIKEMLARYTTDVIGSCAFGLECNSFTDPDAEFRKFGRKLFAIGLVRRIKFLLAFVFPRKFLHSISLSLSNTEVVNFFINVVKDMAEYREKNNICRKDFMHLLLQLKNRGKVTNDDRILADEGEKGILTINEIAAQALLFFAAGFETSSTTMTFVLYELARNQDIQQKLRNEINTTLNKCNGHITYEAVMEMSYMDKIVNETLRKYPPAGLLMRACNKDYKIPNSDVNITRGMRVLIPVFGLHHDPQYYPNPEVFDPERFDEVNKNSRPAMAFLPFGEGPRNCIGLRFGLMQTKVGLSMLLSKFVVTLNTKTQNPLKFDPRSLITSALGGIWLDIRAV